MVLTILKRLWSGKPPVRIDHPTLGTAQLITKKAGAWWTVDTLVENKAFSLLIDTRNAQVPSTEQAEFFRRFALAPDEAFALAGVVLVPEYEKWLRESFPSNWREAFEFVGMTVPLDGNEMHPWELSFECLKDRDGHLFTCHIEGGKPSYLTIDG